MVISIENDLCAMFLESGGYTVHPVPTPIEANDALNRRTRDGGRSQKLMLFIRGKAISGEPIIKGTNQLPNPPIIMGITIKKIMTKACEVTMELYS